VTFVALQAISFRLPATLLTAQLLGVALSLAFLAMVRAACVDGPGPTLRLLAFLGISSMGIYLAHTIFSAGVRAALGRVTQDLSLHMIAGTLVGIVGPLVLYGLIRRIGRPAWIGF
jgi:peptidoglycan/LPS O-acetylase OafA/YrhL